MSPTPCWMVRAGRGGRFASTFREENLVGIGWSVLGDLSRFTSRQALTAAYRETLADETEQQIAVGTGQIRRFLDAFAIGDRVVTYDPSTRLYHRGTIEGGYEYRPDAADDVLVNRRRVRWVGETSRDDLRVKSRNSLGALSTIFAIAPDVAEDLWAPETARAAPRRASDETDALDDALDMEGIANEAIKDRLVALDWEEMQELVAGLLRAMGFKTKVSKKGPDRGKDITASPDGFGFRDPRIVVEVKHRRAQMGAPDIRSFLGGRHPTEKGLYVSTGGFSRDAYYEAERANVPTTLMDSDDLVKAIQEHYHAFDMETKQLFPLKRLYVTF